MIWSEHYIKQRHQRRRYVDIGANTAETLSNTYFFDRCLGWSGICVEPQRQYHASLLTRRTCDLVPTCVSDRMRHVEFLNAKNLGGVSSTNENLKNAARGKRRRGSKNTTWEEKHNEKLLASPVEALTCVPISTLLDRRGWSHVDVLSIE